MILYVSWNIFIIIKNLLLYARLLYVTIIFCMSITICNINFMENNIRKHTLNSTKEKPFLLNSNCTTCQIWCSEVILVAGNSMMDVPVCQPQSNNSCSVFSTITKHILLPLWFNFFILFHFGILLQILISTLNFYNL